MLRIKTLFLAIAVTAAPMLSMPTSVEAGPLLDWIRGRRNNTCNTCAPQYNVGRQTYAAHNPAGLQPNQCMRTCQKTCSRTVVNYVPHTAYRTCWKQVPVTQYKPVTNNDPCTGCTVTCMRPCTSYTYQMQRVPYTTYRPVYRQETYKVPVTTITNNCATGNCGTCPTGTCSTGTCGTGCSTCGPTNVTNSFPTPGPTNYSPTQSSYAPPATVNSTRYEYPSSTTVNGGGTITTQGNFNSLPADSVPSLQGINPQSSTRPVLDQLRQGNSYDSVRNQRQVDYPQQPVPTVVTYSEKTAQAPQRKEWSYSPVRLASYESNEVERTTTSRPLQIRGQFKPVSRSSSSDLNGWVEVE